MERFGGYFVVEVRADAGEVCGPSLRSVYGGEGLAERIDDVCGRLGTAERRVGASILFQGYAARIFSPLFGAVALNRPLPALCADEVYWSAAGFVAAGDTPAEVAPDQAEMITRIAITEHLEPMILALRKEVAIAEGLLWGNAASSLVGTVKVIANAGALDQRTADVASRVLAHPELREAGVFTDGVYKRRSCCLYYRVPHGGLCGDCGLDRKVLDNTR